MRDRPLPVLLCLLTAITGIVDAVSFLALGHVFVANMTGNVVFVAFAAAGAPDLSIGGSLLALAAFMLGAFVAGRWGAKTQAARMVRLGVVAKGSLTAAALAVIAIAGTDGAVRYASIALLAVAMGLQGAVVLRVAGGEPSTNILTSTLTALAASAPIGGAHGPVAHRVLAALALLAGAGFGAVLVLRAGPAAALAFALVLLGASAFAIHGLYGHNVNPGE
ncbi:MAG: YoaK family protein [Burkholderiales bacterium]